MTLANVLLGLVIGLPMMIAFGPISVLLFDQGIERGVRSAAPAAIGVASADLTFSAIAAVAGVSITRLLAPVEQLMVLAAVGVLLWIASAMARSALTELKRLKDGAEPSPASPGTPEVHVRSVDHAEQELLVHVGAVGDPGVAGGPDRLADSDLADRAGFTEHDLVGAAPLVGLRGARLAAAFYGLTMVNPVTIVLFASVVVAGTPGVGTPGWAIGMFLASLLAHGGFVVLGGVLGSALSEVATARIRLGAAAFMIVLAAHFLTQALTS